MSAWWFRRTDESDVLTAIGEETPLTRRAPPGGHPSGAAASHGTEGAPRTRQRACVSDGLVPRTLLLGCPFSHASAGSRHHSSRWNHVRALTPSPHCRPRRSYLTPVRDEEAESLRKARSRQARQTRRSTQVGAASFLSIDGRASPTRDWSAGCPDPRSAAPWRGEQRGSAVLGERAGEPEGLPSSAHSGVTLSPCCWRWPCAEASFGAGPSLTCPLSPGSDSDRPAGGRKDLQPVSGGAAGSGPAWPESGHRRAGGPRREV